MAISLSNLVKNFAEVIYKVKCKYKHNDKKCETYGIKKKNYECFLKYTGVKYDLTEYKCLFCNKNYQKVFDKNLEKWLVNSYILSNHDFDKFTLLLWMIWMIDIQWNFITWKRT